MGVLRQLENKNKKQNATQSAVQPTLKASETVDEDKKSATVARRDSQAMAEVSEFGVDAYPGYWPMNYYTSFGVGCVIGLVGGFFGIGAGVLKVPIFTELFGITKDDARTLSLLILLPPVSVGAVIKYAMEDDIDWYMTLVLLASYMAANSPGAKKGLNASA